MTLDLSFIICTYNGARRLPETLSHLALQANLTRYSWEVLVIDNASTDGTSDVACEWLDRFPVSLEVIRENTPGKTHALKTGLRRARGRYFTIVDDDNHLCPDWVDVAVGFMDAHPMAGVIGGRIDPTFEAQAIIPRDFHERYKGFLAIRDCGEEDKSEELPIGAGMTGRTKLMSSLYERLGSYLSDRVGGGLGSCEDLEKSLTIQLLGWEVWYVQGLRMRHWIPQSRLTEEYIDQLWVEAAIANVWLGVLRNLGPTDHLGLRHLGARDRRLLRYETLRCCFPAWSARQKRARFWRGYYEARLRAYAEIERRSNEVRRIFEFIRTASPDLRPEVSQKIELA